MNRDNYKSKFIYTKDFEKNNGQQLVYIFASCLNVIEITSRGQNK